MKYFWLIFWLLVALSSTTWPLRVREAEMVWACAEEVTDAQTVLEEEPPTACLNCPYNTGAKATLIRGRTGTSTPIHPKSHTCRASSREDGLKSARVQQIYHSGEVGVLSGVQNSCMCTKTKVCLHEWNERAGVVLQGWQFKVFQPRLLLRLKWSLSFWLTWIMCTGDLVIRTVAMFNANIHHSSRMQRNKYMWKVYPLI